MKKVNPEISQSAEAVNVNESLRPPGWPPPASLARSKIGAAATNDGNQSCPSQPAKLIDALSDAVSEVLPEEGANP